MNSYIGYIETCSWNLNVYTIFKSILHKCNDFMTCLSDVHVYLNVFQTTIIEDES